MTPTFPRFTTSRRCAAIAHQAGFTVRQDAGLDDDGQECPGWSITEAVVR